MNGGRRLELNHPEFGIRAESFFRLMSLSDFQKEFLENPGAVVAREFRIHDVDEQRIDVRNKLIHRLLGDDGFNAWAAEFQSRIEREFPPMREVSSIEDIIRFVRAKENRDRLIVEFSQSALEHLAPESFEELIRDGGIDSRLVMVAEPDIALVPLTFIAIIVVLVIAAGLGRTVDQISRVNVRTTINQLTPEQIQLIERIREARQ